MPRVRAKNKVYFDGFVERPFAALIKRVARKEMPKNAFGFAMGIVRNELRRRGYKIAEPTRNLGGLPRIRDEFSDLPLSRQRKHQLRKEKLKARAGGA